MQLVANGGARAASGQHDYDSQCKYTCTDAPFTTTAVLIKFTCTSYTKRHDHSHPSSARTRARARDRPKDMIGLPIRIP